MLRAPLPILALLLAAPLLAGCVATESAREDDAVGPAALPDVSAYLPPTGEGAVAFLDDYVMTHPYRIASQPGFMAKARDDLAATLEGFGLTVERHAYSDTGTNILAYKPGVARPDEWIVLSAHYDTTETTVYGAWDDGAGTAMLLELARAGATRAYARTVVYAFFDEEEQGLLGSKAFVQDYQRRVELVANLNFDPPGLNWPCRDAQGPLPVKIILNDEKTEKGTRGYPELRAAVIAGLDAAEVPEEARDFDPGIPIAMAAGRGLRGTSDHASFDKVNVPNAFIGSAPTTRAGDQAAALTYLLHTPLDTKAQMAARCGGEDLLAQAFDVEMRITTTALDILDAAVFADEPDAAAG